MLEIARDEAKTIFEADPYLENPEHLLLQKKVMDFWQKSGDVS